MRGRKPKATHLKLLHGNPGCYPLGTDPEFMASPQLPPPPDILGEDARQEWVRLTPETQALGLLRIADEKCFAAYCQAYGRWVQAERALAVMAVSDPQTHALLIKTSNGNVIQNPLVGVANQAARDMVRYAVEFGLTPSARARLATHGYSSPPKSKFGGLIG